MRASRALAVAAAAIAAVGLSAPMAAAGGDAGQGGSGQGGRGQGGDGGVQVLSVSPEAVHQGGTLTVTVRGCNRGGTVTSNAFPQTNLSQARNGISTATARVNDNAAPGQYNLAVRCNDSQGIATAQFTVLAGRGAQGGLGGSVGPSGTEMAIGGGLVATAAVGGSLFIVRRRRMISGKV
ncbi:hypothetical protein FBY35_0925 [Streptomyces sp. SLBN-118]|uniref:hypothetical protein n=1 Tax=Streptomyces sp. SLBN-118 TaxID=2768454 RepID=UPI001151EC0A|nr:hypothetical protein [Streptomyces sp. SLBN-118]TQK50588.1 hypothetical protein FBY35_0925 [Streptomyces sp. SLBN-118]